MHSVRTARNDSESALLLPRGRPALGCDDSRGRAEAEDDQSDGHNANGETDRKRRCDNIKLNALLHSHTLACFCCEFDTKFVNTKRFDLRQGVRNQ